MVEIVMRALALLTCLAALPAAAETPDRSAEVARWFSHCAAFDSRDDAVHGFALVDWSDTRSVLFVRRP